MVIGYQSFLPGDDDTTGDDGGLYGPRSPAPPLGRTPNFTGDGTAAAAVVALVRLPAAAATGISADAAAGFVATAATAGLCAAAANAELNAAAASAGFCPSNAAACVGSRA